LNYLATDSPRGPIAISLIEDGTQYKALIRVTQGSERLSIASVAVPKSFLRKAFGMSPSKHDVFAALSRNIPAKNLRLCKDTNLPNELLAMEERQVIRSYKFGVGYLAKGQSTEEQMMSNKMGMWWKKPDRRRGLFARIQAVSLIPRRDYRA
jgi:RAP1 GTPase activating protein 1